MPTSASSISSALILCATSFSLGVLYSNWPYDFFTLWTAAPPESRYTASLDHYKAWYDCPMFVYHIHHTVIGLGLIGFFIKLYKPSESNKLFDGGSLFLYMVGVTIYLTNIRRGLASAVDGNWGDVDEHTGINVIAASQVMIVFVLLGVLGLQVGQWWAEREDAKLKKKFDDEEKKEKKDKKESKESKKTK
ncbi:Shr3 amino acid permease chaperone [Yarrowia lipolytica]|jgi:hypothetical protein|uniref:YALI0E23716p n=2 Tax=Yarrowia lipolytica TaxID=4952 RepID=Q6C4U0_YARLI|nr:YALI0E23716p [Yarrowia lipolytica CLIB122]AOW05866.1 hypothetical protein YALI1_E28046g [Yarrowia lipolytica]KAB8285928.1 Shr3 amino acid permease chaperone [Yarrowia lipolytica]KAE8172521.1 Shr3 amino acid permease chaperone [Yarrowia lipolytica]KAJ8057297.1 Shr3 amino acid permease chaperone [Yarrowia lipolytica]QNP99160.1 Hypothetical protein YALI2_E00476g [Yarrowia lipolytica]|eukprot:XP_504322.1 YALI0E23716p [Yarrowia lipolytica CLIB122]